MTIPQRSKSVPAERAGQTKDAGGETTSRSNEGLFSGNREKMGAGAAGAGTGTLLVVLAQNLSDSNPLKSWLVLAAPTASISLSGFWLWIRRALEARSREREKAQLFARLHETLLKAMADPHVSPEHKEYLRKRLEELATLEVSTLYERIKLLEMD